MANTREQDKDEDALLDLMASSMISHFRDKNGGKLAGGVTQKPGALEGQHEEHDGAGFLSVKDDDDAALEASLASKQLSWKPDLGLGASMQDRGVLGVTAESAVKVPALVEKDGLLPPRNLRKERREAQKAKAETAGPKWFDLPATPITPDVKRDLRLLKLRGVLDPKRHYKAPDSTKLPKYFQIGTVVEGATDFYSGRMTKSERKPSLTAELLADQNLKTYRKRKYSQIQQEKESGGKKWFKKKKSKQKPNWARS